MPDTVEFPIRAIEAHPSRFADGALARQWPVPVTADPAMPEDEIHIIADGRRIVIKLKPTEAMP